MTTQNSELDKPNTMDDWIDRILEDVAIKSANQYGGFEEWESPQERAEVIEEAKALITAKLQEVDRAAREDGFIKKLAEYPIFEQQLVLGGLLYKYLMEDTNATTATITIKNFSRHDKILGNLEIKASLKGGDV